MTDEQMSEAEEPTEHSSLKVFIISLIVIGMIVALFAVGGQHIGLGH